MKKILGWALTLLMLLSCISLSCAEERTVLYVTRACFNLRNPVPSQVKKVENAINAYIADKINVEIRLTEIGSNQYGQKVWDLVRQGKEINLLWTASWEDVIGTNQLVANHAVYDLTDLLPGTPLHSAMTADLWEETRYNGRNYFVPVDKDNVEGYDFMFRKELADAHGWNLDAVHSLKDLEPLLADAKADGLRYPFLTQNTSMFYRWYIDRFDFFTGDVRTNFFGVDRETDEVVNTVATPEYLEFCQLMGRWADLGYISEDEVNRVTTDTTTQTKNWGISWWTDVPVNSEASARYGQPIAVRKATERYAHSNSALGSCYCVTAGSTKEQARAAVEFLGLLYRDRALADMYTYGLEGEDFEYTQTEEQAIRHVTLKSMKYNHSTWESASVMSVTPLDNEPDNKVNLYLDFNGSAIDSPAVGFRFDRTPVEEQFTACQALFEQYGFRLENGGVPEAEVAGCIAEYQNALDAAGYQDVLAEFQRQYDEWKKTTREG